MPRFAQTGVQVAEAGRQKRYIGIFAVRSSGLIGKQNFHGEKKSGSSDPDTVVRHTLLDLFFKVK